LQTQTYILATSKPWHKPLSAKYLTSEQQFLWAHNPEELNKLVSQEQEVRYIFFLHWNWQVPESLWENYECVCFHMTDVPYGRGGSPLQNLIVRGHTDTKLSALRMVKEMDSGPVYTKRALSLEGTAEKIYQRAGELSFDIIRWMINNSPKPSTQQGETVVFKRRKPEQSALPESGNVTKLYDHIRMLDAPTYPPAFIEHGEFVIEFAGAELQGGELNASVRIRKKPNQRKL
jgi:methionyl-tRNA formyltransferase